MTEYDTTTSGNDTNEEQMQRFVDSEIPKG